MGGGIAFAGSLGTLVSVPWAIHPAARDEMLGIYERHLRGEAADIAAIEARLGRPLNNEPQRHEVRPGGVAVVPIVGAIVPKANLMTQVSGATSAQAVARDLQAAIADPAVRSIVLAIDSPGGSTFGTPELAQAVRDAAALKPVVTHSDGALASAAYWIGAAANAIFIAGPTVQVGSIGVAAAHRDLSVAQAKEGVTTTEITAGKYKRIASAYAPLTKEGRASIQDQVDFIYGVFVDSVASDRGVSVDTVLANMADGRVFIGQQAVQAGLVDGVMSLDALVSDLAADPARYAQRRRAGAALDKTTAKLAHALTSATRSTGAASISTMNPRNGSQVALSAFTPAAAAAADTARADRTAQAQQAKAYAAEHGVGFVTAWQLLGFDGELAAQNARAAAVNRYATKHNVSLSAAIVALGYA